MLGRLNWKHGYAFPSYGTLAHDTGYSVRHAMRSVTRLKKRGLVMTKNRTTHLGDRDSNAYTIPVLVGPAIPSEQRKGGGDIEVMTGIDLEVMTGGAMHGVQTSERGTCEGVNSEKESSPSHQFRNNTTNLDSVAVRARCELKKPDDDAEKRSRKIAMVEASDAEALQWLCDVARVSIHRITQHQRDTSVTLPEYADAIRVTRQRYNIGDLKHLNGLLGYVATAKNAAKGIRPDLSGETPSSFSRLASVLPETLQPQGPRGPIKASPSLLSSQMLQRMKP